MSSKLAIALEHNGEPIPFINYIGVDDVKRRDEKITDYKAGKDTITWWKWKQYSSENLIYLSYWGNKPRYPLTWVSMFRLDCFDGRQFLIEIPTSKRSYLQAQCEYNYDKLIENESANLITIWLTIGSYLPLNDDLKFLIKGLIIDHHKWFLDRLDQICE
jgi:hypothetical protein